MINNIQRLPFQKFLNSRITLQNFAILHKPIYNTGYTKILLTNKYEKVSKK